MELITKGTPDKIIQRFALRKPPRKMKINNRNNPIIPMKTGLTLGMNNPKVIIIT
jgi:hypothetical protein